METTIIPAVIDEYSVEKSLGNGAYGITYLVRDGKENPFALKLLRSDAPAEGRFRMENEEHALKQINDPSFPTFIKSGVYDGRPFIVMSYAEGQTIKNWIESNIKDQAFFGGLRVLLILEKLLLGLSSIHKIPILHRDVKDDNIIISTSGREVTILDLGQSTGSGTPHPDITFWNIGAARFSPPSKLENPSVAIDTHDVFSVGVTAYRMLTNAYPWEVPPSQDVGFLKKLMETSRPTVIHQINSAVDPRISSIVTKMLEPKDYLRDEAKVVLSDVSALREQLEKQSAPQYQKSKGILRLSRVMRDPLHGDIRLTDYEKAVVDTREFQRLRRIRQLGTAHLVYHGAEHTRFSHAIGTMEIAERIMRSIEIRDGSQFTHLERQAARLFALVHDITHAPFGHTLEDELGFFERHDQNAPRIERMMRHTRAQLPTLLQQTDYGRVVLDLISKREVDPEFGWIVELVASPIGADVIDYIDRDAMFCGLDHRIDSALYRSFIFVENRTLKSNQRILKSKLEGRHGFRLDVDYAIGSILRERFALFMKAYGHPTKVVAGAMVGKALRYGQTADKKNFGESVVELMGDDELLLALRNSSSSKSQRIGDAILNRNLYEPVYRARVMTDDFDDISYRKTRDDFRNRGYFGPENREAFERRLAIAAGLEDDDVIFYCSPKAPGAKSVSSRSRVGEGGVGPIRIDPLRDHKDIFKRHLELWNMYVFVKPDAPINKKQLLANIAEGELSSKNEVDINYRQLALDW